MRSSALPVALALLLCRAPFSHAQQPAPDPVAISCTCSDSTGRLFAAALHELLIHSSRYREVAAGPVPSPAAARFSIVSLPVDDDSEGHSRKTALSIVFLRNGAMLDHLVETCDRSAVDSCARGAVAAFESSARAH